MTSRYRTIICAGMLGTQALTGCAKWQPSELSPQALVENYPDKLRVRQTDGLTYVLHSPTIGRDTLIGRVKSVERRVPLSSVAELSIRKAPPAGLVVAGIVVLGFSAIMVFGCNPDPDQPLKVC